MRLILSTWNWLKPYGDSADLHEALRAIRKTGFGAELWLNWTANPGLLDRSRWSEIGDLCSGLPALSAHSALTQRFSQEELYEEMDLCATLGAEPLVCHPRTFGLEVGTLATEWDGPLKDEEIARIADILEQAAARSVRLSLENGPPEVLSAVLESMEDHPGRSHLGICIDTGHANLHHRSYESPAPEFLRRFAGELIHLHLNDNHGDSDEHLVPGQGTVDWPEVFEALGQKGRSVTAVLELADREPEIAADRARRFVEARLR